MHHVCACAVLQHVVLGCKKCVQLALPPGCSVIDKDKDKIICTIARTREVADEVDTPAAAAPAKAATSADKSKAPAVAAEKGKAVPAAKAAEKSK